MSERLPPERVRKVARLARLALSDDEVRLFSGQLGEVLDYVEVLRDVPTDDVPPTAQPLAAACPMRGDDPAASAVEPLLRNAPELVHGLFAVPRVVESDE
ncbi:MAG: Asp-tRNA(Asn)/Glu-tRNA(Gln) amidotransferase subunit GatC [Deltaproteobacteria bacterium]|nr:Asp-tRNA(Asn)/Glu-tRNA(Gln) amidotransferase subunit GatC [Deltaproteobacteria bacterium]